MKHFSISAFLIFLTFTKLFAQEFTDCTVHGFLYTRVEQAPKFNGSLQEYFENEFKGRIQKSDDAIQLKILIDTGGKACCLSINYNNSGISSSKIKKAISKMNGWTSAKQNNYSVNYAVLLDLVFNDSKLVVNYLNEKAVIPKPFVNTNSTNNPFIFKERKNNVVWKLWNFNNSMVPANLSRNVAMDTSGVIWYCTDHGIVKIVDENHWQIFNGMNVQALSGKNNITWTTGLAVDKTSNVWIMSSDCVVKYDGTQWIKYDTSNSPLKFVSKICVDKNGIIWFCTFEGLVKYDGSSWTKYTRSNSKIASDHVNEVYLDINETLWIATDSGINMVVNGNWSLLNKENSGIPDNNIRAIKGDLTGNIWGGAGTGVNNYFIKIDTAKNISIFSGIIIWNITVDNNANKIWLATNSNGLLSFDGKGFDQYDQTNSIVPTTIVSDILIDKNGDKWISTFGGLVFTSKK
jgi:hypothetical protein